MSCPVVEFCSGRVARPRVSLQIALSWPDKGDNRQRKRDLKGFPAEVNRGFPRADRGRILCALIRREVGHARNVSQ